MVFRKGNKYKFTDGNIPHNKKRKCSKPVKSDSKTNKYIRLTKEKHKLVVNDPYTDPEEKAKRVPLAASLLRPKTKEVSKPKVSKKKSVKDKR